MSIRITSLFLSIIAAISPCLGDVFILKDGGRIEGRILQENPDSYLIEINISKSIKDERLVPKAELLKIEREQPDLIAFKKIEGLYPAPDLLAAPHYEERIAAVQAYLKEFPYSAKSNQAKEMLKTLQAESLQVADGGIKLDGEIFSVQQYRANAYELDARIAAMKIRKSADAGNWLAALREFTDFEQDFAGSPSYEALRPLIRKVIITYRDQISALLTSLDARQKARLDGLERMTLEDRANSEIALAEEAASLDARYQNEKSSKFRWPTIHPFHKSSLEDTVRLAEQELSRLQTVSNTQAEDGAQAFRDAWRAVHSGDLQSKSEALALARTARLPSRYLQMLEAAIAASGN